LDAARDIAAIEIEAIADVWMRKFDSVALRTSRHLDASDDISCGFTDGNIRAVVTELRQQPKSGDAPASN
jgi:hypothetical protein